MAAGDNIGIVPTSVANNGYLTIQPSGDAVWQINNINCGGSWQLYQYDGTNSILIESGYGPGGLQKRAITATNTVYLRVKNISGGSAYFSYEGVVWK